MLKLGHFQILMNSSKPCRHLSLGPEALVDSVAFEVWTDGLFDHTSICLNATSVMQTRTVDKQ